MGDRYRRPMGSVRWTKLARETNPEKGCGRMVIVILLLIVAVYVLRSCEIAF